MKKFLSLCLSVLLVVSVCVPLSITAFAEGEEEVGIQPLAFTADVTTHEFNDYGPVSVTTESGKACKVTSQEDFTGKDGPCGKFLLLQSGEPADYNTNDPDDVLYQGNDRAIVKFPFTVAANGLYDISYIATSNKSAHVVYLDTTDGDPLTVIEGAETERYFLGMGHGAPFTATAELNAGQTYELIFALSPTDTGYYLGKGHFLFSWDTLTVQQSTSVPTIATGGTHTFEFEDYVSNVSFSSSVSTKTIDVQATTGASEGEWLQIATTSSIAQPGYASIPVQVYVADAGLYDLEIAAGNKNGPIYVTIDNVGGNRINLGEKVVESAVALGSRGNLTTYTSTVALPAGLHTLFVKIYTEDGADFPDAARIFKGLDCLTIKPATQAAQIADSGRTTVKVADYVNNYRTSNGAWQYLAKPTVATSAAAGSYLVVDQTSDKGTYGTGATYQITFPVEVLKDTTFTKLEYVAGAGGSVTTSVSIDSVALAEPRVTDFDTKDDSGKWNYFKKGWSQAQAYIYNYDNVTLTKGIHYVTIDITPYATSGSAPWTRSQYLACVDYIAFIAPEAVVVPENSIETVEDTTTATVYYDEAVAGKAILALYDGDVLVSIGFADIDEATTEVVVAADAAEYTKAKVFVWDGLTNCKPVVAEVEF